MAMRASWCLFGGFLLVMTGWLAVHAADDKAGDDRDKPGASPQQPLAVSLVQLIARPDAFEGKYVRVQGFVRIEHEGNAIYLHREDWEHSLTKNGLWLAASDSAPEGSKEAEVNNRYALIEGRFTGKKHGHLGLWSGSIEEITRMQASAVRGGKR